MEAQFRSNQIECFSKFSKPVRGRSCSARGFGSRWEKDSKLWSSRELIIILREEAGRRGRRKLKFSLIDWVERQGGFWFVILQNTFIIFFHMIHISICDYSSNKHDSFILKQYTIHVFIILLSFCEYLFCINNKIIRLIMLTWNENIIKLYDATKS